MFTRPCVDRHARAQRGGERRVGLTLERRAQPDDDRTEVERRVIPVLTKRLLGLRDEHPHLGLEPRPRGIA